MEPCRVTRLHQMLGRQQAHKSRAEAGSERCALVGRCPRAVNGVCMCVCVAHGLPGYTHRADETRSNLFCGSAVKQSICSWLESLGPWGNAHGLTAWAHGLEAWAHELAGHLRMPGPLSKRGACVCGSMHTHTHTHTNTHTHTHTFRHTHTHNMRQVSHPYAHVLDARALGPMNSRLGSLGP